MKIKTSLLLAALAPALMTVFAGMTISWGYRTTQAAQQQVRGIEYVIRSINELNSLVDSYLLYHEERPRQQFLAEHDELAKRFSAVQLQNAEQRQILASIRDNAESMKGSFSRLVDLFEIPSPTPDDAALRSAGTRVAGQLKVKARQAVANSVRLQGMVNQQRTAIQTTVNSVVLCLILGVTGVITVVLFATMRRVTASLATLGRGTEAVGTGRLDHRIGLSGRDELAALARSFDSMTERLQTVTVSKNELEREVRERRQAEAALRESEERLALALNAGQIGMFAWDVSTGDVLCTLQTELVFGFPPPSAHPTTTQHSYQDWVDCIHPDDLPRIELRLRECMAQREPFETEYRVVWSDGSVHWIDARGLFTFDAEGRPTRMLGTVMDITERKWAEQRLRESEQRIRASLSEKEVLLKEIHHRVKNNMQVISSLVALQAERLPEAAMRGVLQDVAHRVRSMALVHEKLYQSRDLARVEFDQYARSLLTYLWRAHAAAASGIKLVLDLEPIELSVDRAVPCGLILNELASNALKHAFRDRAGGEVAVSLHRASEGRVCLHVRDNGIGLPQGFEWRRADSLGLHLIQLLAAQLSATVKVTGTEGTEIAIVFGDTKG
ncbi:MAG: HAMP domain-containing protein [Pirellulaceae bacterium]